MKRAIIFAIAVTLSGAVFASGLEDFKSQSGLTPLDMETINNVKVIMPKAAKKIDIDHDTAFDKLKSKTGIQGSTPYDVLKELFKRGVPATQKDLTGWYSGRSVSLKFPEKFMASLFVGQRKPLNSNGGPLFNEEAFFVTPFIRNNDNPAYYDSLEQSIVEVEYALRNKIDAFPITFPAAEGILEKATIQYRKANGYIVEHYLYLDANGITLSEIYSYYFKNVTPKN